MYSHVRIGRSQRVEVGVDLQKTTDRLLFVRCVFANSRKVDTNQRAEGMDTYGSVVVESTDTESCSAIAASGNFVNKSVKIKPDLVCFGFGLFVFVVFVLGFF